MPPMYIGGGGGTGGSPMPGPMPVWGGRPPIYGGGPISTGGGTSGGGTYSGAPAQLTVPSAPNTVGPQAVRAKGPAQGFDPAYLQNLATAIGGLFSRPQGNLSFNPLGNLSDIKSPGLGVGNAPLPGLPSTMLQDALNGLAFMFNQPGAMAPTGGGGGGSTVGAGGGNVGRNRGGRPIYPE